MENQKSLIQEIVIAWKISSIVFANVVAVIMFFAWWDGETWVRANAGAMVELSQRDGWKTKK
jgi:hypothetical protein